MRVALTMLLVLALVGGGFLLYRRLNSGPAPVWLDLGSLLRHTPGTEALYQAPKEGDCWDGEGSFLPIRRFSSFNRGVQAGSIRHRLSVYVRNEEGSIVALVANDPSGGEPLMVNFGEAGFSSPSGKRWNAAGEPAQGAGKPLLRLPASVSGGTLRVDLRAVTCEAALPAGS